MARIEALIMDSDGTLIDTKDFINGGFRAAYSTAYGIGLKEDDFVPLSGKSLRQCYEILAGRYRMRFTEEEFETCSLLHRTFQEKNLDMVRTFPGTLETIEAVKSHGIKAAVVTTRTIMAPKLLEVAGILSSLDVVVTGDDVKTPKPHPEGILLATARLSVRPQASYMMGDSAPDIEAGRRAGVRKTIGVTYGLEGERIRDASPDYLISQVSQALQIVLRDR